MVIVVADVVVVVAVVAVVQVEPDDWQLEHSWQERWHFLLSELFPKNDAIQTTNKQQSHPTKVEQVGRIQMNLYVLPWAYALTLVTSQYSFAYAHFILPWLEKYVRLKPNNDTYQLQFA